LAWNPESYPRDSKSCTQFLKFGVGPLGYSQYLAEELQVSFIRFFLESIQNGKTIYRGKYSASHVVTVKYDGQYITVFISSLVQLPLRKKEGSLALCICVNLQKTGASN